MLDKILRPFLNLFAWIGSGIAKLTSKAVPALPPAQSLLPVPIPQGKSKKTFGTFQGVFTPTVLTILGVIMYIRQPWVVGNAGVLGALAIICLAIAITFFTALSMSSMTTNIRIGSGGAFSIISQSLGLEIGGSIGIPLYFSQALAVAMYVFGFREGWMEVFPEHSELLVDLITFASVAIVASISTDFAFKIQYVIMALVLGSIISIVGGLFTAETINEIQWVGEFKGTYNAETESYVPSSFWVVFAIFFPAVTGVMAGANMSGDLTNPRVNIPKGTLSAIGLTAVIYIGLIFVAAMLATPEEMMADYNVFINKSAWAPIVLLGLFGATFSSALSSFVGAPRILFALGEFNILPGSQHFTKTTQTGEPRNAMLFTAIVVFISLLARDLNAIAPWISMFFMVTYAMINVVVLIEQSLGLPSFRPTFGVPILVPLLGTIGCFFVMFIINATVSLFAIILIVGFYALLLRQNLQANKGDARSGLFQALAEWATKKTNELSPEREARAWQPEFLIPAEHPNEIKGAYRLIYALTHPKGSVKLLGMKTGGQEESLKQFMPSIVETFKSSNVTATYSMIDGDNFGDTVKISMQALESAFFKPNTVFLKFSENGKYDDYKKIIQSCEANMWGLVLFLPHKEVGLGIEKVVNVWVDSIPDDWYEKMDIGNNDLALLIALIIKKNWNARINLIKTMRDDTFSEEQVIAQLKKIKEIGRIPKDTTLTVIKRDLNMWQKVPQADLNILELPQRDNLDFDILQTIPEKLGTSCVFTVDSGNESVLV